MEIKCQKNKILKMKMNNNHKVIIKNYIKIMNNNILKNKRIKNNLIKENK